MSARIALALALAAGPAFAQVGTSIPNLSGFGNPLPGIVDRAAQGDPTDLDFFAHGQLLFAGVENIPTLGPIFNGKSCGGCHFQPSLGGSGQSINEVRVRNNKVGGPLHIFAVDNMLRLGPQKQGLTTIFPNGVSSTPLGCQITSPGCSKSPCQSQEVTRTTFTTTLKICDPTSTMFASGANCVAERQSPPLFGFGLIEAVADETLDAIAAAQPDAIRGEVKRVNELGRVRAARFGWKNDIATLREFSADAYLNEMGITTPDKPNDLSTCAIGRLKFGVLVDSPVTPDDDIETQNRSDGDRFADFMRALAPPPTLDPTPDSEAGRVLFDQIGCAGCHVPSITTAADPAAFVPPTMGGDPITATLNATLANKTFNPYSDFLLHDMGALGDGITSGAAGPREMRTTPLWGIRGKSLFLHDGRAESIDQAITLHDGQGLVARNAFLALTPAQQLQLLDFINSL